MGNLSTIQYLPKIIMNGKIVKKYTYWILGILIVLAVLLRFWLVSGNTFIFLFDASRDAYLSSQIFTEHKLKIQGPTASGTNDKIFHGVLYYYIIGPIYALSQGNPAPVIQILIIINVLTIIPLFFLTKEITKNSLYASFMAVLFFVFSYLLTEFSIVLSNQIISLPASTLFFYALWKTFFDNKPRWLFVTAFSFGIAVQSGIYMLYLLAAIVLSFFISRQYEFSNNILKRKGILIGSILLFLFTISSLIITELLLIYRGVLNINDLIKLSNTSGEILNILGSISDTYIKHITATAMPSMIVPSFILCAILIIYSLYKFSNKVRAFFIVCYLSPLLLLLFQTRDGAHYIISLTPIIYIQFAYALILIMRHVKYGWQFAIAAIAILIGSNLISIINARNNKYNPFEVQQSAYLKDQLSAIDYTYINAKGKPFTISTLTNPYGYNTTWAYLYNWYGKKKYGYLPSFYGPSQTGIYGNNLISESLKPGIVHFSIYEPPIGIPVYFISQFTNDQTINIGKPYAKRSFNLITVENRSR